MEFKNLPQISPFLNFQEYYLKAEEYDQKFSEAGCISSVDDDNKPHSRFVNFKYFFEESLIFFSSYKSVKANNFEVNKNICINFWWPSIETQVRVEGTISKCEEKFSDEHFFGRDAGKNIAAMISNQSEEIESYDLLKQKYEAAKQKIDSGEIQQSRPDNWGGYQVKVNYFEFWEANESRLNYRECYKKKNDEWIKFHLQP